MVKSVPTLILAIGNPSRGDDALGPLAIERLEAMKLPDVELLTDFQLQVEHVLDLEGRNEVIFIDAAASGPEPFEFRPLLPAHDFAHTSHALAPETVLGVCARVGVTPPVQAHVLAIRGYRFELGEPLSAAAAANLEAALRFLLARGFPPLQKGGRGDF
ncbi:MAG: hydrogenase maturation protease [Betaproteobacteria bacterium]|nr:hydrogenase maturation protease [Betaproteobacteria bacterium]